jgi:hypothetical protein
MNKLGWYNFYEKGILVMILGGSLEEVIIEAEEKFSELEYDSIELVNEW